VKHANHGLLSAIITYANLFVSELQFTCVSFPKTDLNMTAAIAVEVEKFNLSLGYIHEWRNAV